MIFSLLTFVFEKRILRGHERRHPIIFICTVFHVSSIRDLMCIALIWIFLVGYQGEYLRSIFVRGRFRSIIESFFDIVLHMLCVVSVYLVYDFLGNWAHYTLTTLKTDVWIVSSHNLDIIVTLVFDVRLARAAIRIRIWAHSILVWNH